MCDFFHNFPYTYCPFTRYWKEWNVFWHLFFFFRCWSCAATSSPKEELCQSRMPKLGWLLTFSKSSMPQMSSGKRSPMTKVCSCGMPNWIEECIHNYVFFHTTEVLFETASALLWALHMKWNWLFFVVCFKFWFIPPYACHQVVLCFVFIAISLILCVQRWSLSSTASSPWC